MVLKLQKYSKFVFLAIFLILLYLAFLLVKPFAVSVIASLLLVYIFYPLYKWLHFFIKNKNLASFIMLAFIAFMILLPLVFLINALINESMVMYQKFDISKIVFIITSYTSGKIGIYISEILRRATEYLFEITSGLVLSIPKRVLSLAIIVFVSFFGFRDGELWIKKLAKLIPLKERHSKEIKEKFVSTINGVVYGVIIITVLEGIAAIPAFYIFGVSAPFLWGLVMVILAMIPGIGPATVWVPIVLVKLFYGQVWEAVGLAIYSFIVISFLLDFVLKQKLISDKARVHPVITLVGVLGGLNVFGLVGIIIGPLILVLAMLFVDFYIEEVRL